LLILLMRGACWWFADDNRCRLHQQIISYNNDGCCDWVSGVAVLIRGTWTRAQAGVYERSHQSSTTNSSVLGMRAANAPYHRHIKVHDAIDPHFLGLGFPSASHVSEPECPADAGATRRRFIALLLCLVLIGLIVFLYMLIVRPGGHLTVTYQLHEREPS
jgi:hypothetical protein